MLKMLRKNYFKSNLGFFSKCRFSSLHDKVFSLQGRENKFYIQSSGVDHKKVASLVVADIYAKFYKLFDKTVINPLYTAESDIIRKLKLDFDLEENSQNSETFYKNLLNFLIENKTVYDKQNKQNNQTEYYFNLKNSNYLQQLEKDDSLLKPTWPAQIISNGHKLLNKKSNVKVKFTILNELNAGASAEVDINIEKPEFLFGVTFLSIKSNKDNSDLINSLKIDNLIKDKKSNFVLPNKIFAINPINDEKIAILINADNKSESESESDNIRACIPGHDMEDFKLAKENSLHIKYVAKPINEMGDSVFNSPAKENPLANRNKSMEQIKQELVNYKKNESPLMLSHNEAFLVNCKQFDFLYLDEARELLVNSLIKKGKAERKEIYDVDDWLIAKKKNDENNNEYIFEELFKSSSNYLRCLDMNKDRFKKWLPVDLLIINKDSKHSEDYFKFLFYSRIIHKLLLRNYFGEDKAHHETDTVYLNKEQELEKDILFPAPYKHLIVVGENKALTIPKEINEKETDNLRLKVLFNCSNYEDKQITTFFQNLKDFHSFVLTSCSSLALDIDKIRDELITVNELSDNKIVSDIFQKIIDSLDIIKQNKEQSLLESFKKTSNVLSDILTNKNLFSDNPNFLFYLYFNYLLIINPFCPYTSNSNFTELRAALQSNPSSKFTFKENINEYSLSSLNSSCNYFLYLLKNTQRYDIIINKEKMGTVIVDSSQKLGEEKGVILEFVKESLGIDFWKKEEEVTEYRVEDSEIHLTIIR